MENSVIGSTFSGNWVESTDQVKSVFSENITVELQDTDLWKKFNNVPTEMIISKQGRRMFPRFRVKISGLDADKMYCVTMDLQRADSYKYRFMNNKWETKATGDPDVKPQYYIHPSSPARGYQWLDEIVSFHKVKLTNSATQKQNGKFVVNSMHRYVPRIYVICSDDVNNLSNQVTSSFSSPETAFFAVTSYQNSELVECKIAYNPFARAFRDGKRTKSRASIQQAHKKKKFDINYKMTDSLPNASVIQSSSDSTSSMHQQSVPWNASQTSDGNFQANNYHASSTVNQACASQTTARPPVNLHDLGFHPNNQISNFVQNQSAYHSISQSQPNVQAPFAQSSTFDPSFQMQDTNCSYPYQHSSHQHPQPRMLPYEGHNPVLLTCPSSHGFYQNDTAWDTNAMNSVGSQFNGSMLANASCLPVSSNIATTKVYSLPHCSSHNQLFSNSVINASTTIRQFCDQATDLSHDEQIASYNI